MLDIVSIMTKIHDKTIKFQVIGIKRNMTTKVQFIDYMEKK